jgi:hypothetical protein
LHISGSRPNDFTRLGTMGASRPAHAGRPSSTMKQCKPDAASPLKLRAVILALARADAETFAASAGFSTPFDIPRGHS